MWRGNCPQRLIVMTRIPELGRAKTRLIPALGETGANAVHTALMQRTLATASNACVRFQADIEVRYSGPENKLDSVPGRAPDQHWRPQSDGHLGQRLIDAFQAAFSEGAERVLIIGTDCPQLTETHLAEAWQRLASSDVVLGPAADGGYYLLGLTQPQPELFQGIDWGTDSVLQATRERCRDIKLSASLLNTLSDVDEPEDLIVCRQYMADSCHSLPSIQPGLISVVIPALNEAKRLPQTVEPILAAGCEVVLADGGSDDGGPELAEQLGCRVVRANRGRGRQLNAGAAFAHGEFLLFLHADTQLPETFVDDLRATLTADAIAGAYQLRLTHPATAFRWVEWGTNLRARTLQLPYGDQGLFLRAADFYRLGGFRNWPLMEDFELCQRLKKQGRIRIAHSAVTTSARRWEQLGIIRTTLINQWCILRYLCGASPETLADFYRRQKRR